MLAKSSRLTPNSRGSFHETKKQPPDHFRIAGVKENAAVKMYITQKVSYVVDLIAMRAEA
jgi:hypothetical protein